MPCACSALSRPLNCSSVTLLQLSAVAHKDFGRSKSNELWDIVRCPNTTPHWSNLAKHMRLNAGAEANHNYNLPLSRSCSPFVKNWLQSNSLLRYDDWPPSITDDYDNAWLLEPLSFGGCTDGNGGVSSSSSAARFPSPRRATRRPLPALGTGSWRCLLETSLTIAAMF